MRHVGKAHAEAIVIRPGQRVVSLQVDVVADQHQRALLVGEIDSSRRVGKNDGANSHTLEDPHGEGDLLRRISLIKMDAALHRGHGNSCGHADHHLSGVADGRRKRKSRNLSKRDAR